MSNFLLSQLLNCGYLDVDFLEELIEEFNVDLDIECIKKEFGNINVNILIYKVFDEIKNNFLKENKYEIEAIIGESLDNGFDFEDYEIFTNYIDSHLRFKNDEIEDLFQNWKNR